MVRARDHSPHYQLEVSAPKLDAVAVKIEEALAGIASDKSVDLGVHGYTVRRARGNGASGFVATKNQRPWPA